MNFVRNTARKAIHSKTWVKVSRYLRNLPDPEAVEKEFSADYPQGRVLIYFGDMPPKLYQLIQWLPVFEKLNTHIPVVILVRRPATALELSSQTSLPIVFAKSFSTMMDFLHRHNFRLTIYVNNGLTNFQSMGYGQAVHVHVNHGESDKVSMVSNQAKAYDKVFVAGDAAIARHHRAILDFDFSKLVKVGRPQLDFVTPTALRSFTGKTVMYAPTWEGENEANNYTSVDLYGPQIVQAVLAQPKTRLIYKPHPRVEDSKDPGMILANNRIRALIAEAVEAGAQHEVAMQGDILGMFDNVDMLVTDISSVGLDFLYLHPEKSLVLTDRRSNLAALHEEAPISRATPVIEASNIHEVPSLLEAELNTGGNIAKRQELRSFYFGNGQVGDSSQVFFATVKELIAQREADLERVSHVANTHGAESEDTGE